MNRLIDTHNHILYGIDDGSNSLDESIQMIKSLKELGFTDLIITPHYIDGTEYNYNNLNKNRILDSIKKRIKEEKIDINLYLGNEIFINDNIIEYMNKREIMTLNNSKYLLMEVPFIQKINNLKEFLIKLINKGYVPIIAHPERYQFLQEDKDLIKEYIDMGILFQSNYASITGRYGRKAKKLFKYYLKKGYIFILGSDVHHDSSSFYSNFYKMKKKIIKIIGEDEFVKLTFTNPKLIIENKDCN